MEGFAAAEIGRIERRAADGPAVTVE